MPFKSEKQRRYLWANEPKIARDWTDRYGARGGGIMRIPLGTGGFPDFFQMTPENIATARNTSWPNAIKQDWSAGWRRNPTNVAPESRVGARSYINQGIDSLKGKFTSGSNVGGATNLMRKAALGVKNVLPRVLSKAALPFELLRATPANADEINMTAEDFQNLRNENATTSDNKIKDTQYDWEGNFRGSNRPDWWGKSVPTNKQTAPRSLGFDTSYGVANEADVAQEPLTQEKGNIFQQGWQGAKDFKTSIGEGITGILDNTMIGKIAAMNNALNPRAWNYNPALQGQIDYLKGSGDYGVMDATGLNKITGGVLAGKNLQSMFGVNDLGKLYDKSISRTQKTLANLGKKWSRLKKDDPDEYKRIEAFHRNKLKQKEREKKLAGIAASKDLERRKTASRDKWQKDYSTWTSPSGRDHVTTGGIGSPESKKGPAGGSIGASRFLARGGRASYFNGGLASLWPR